MKLSRLMVIATLALTGCSRSCKSPVPPDQTVHLRGSAGAGIRLVMMANPSGSADRSASVDPQGRYEFAWTGRDLTGFWGERNFSLRAPADVEEGSPWTTSNTFYLTADLEAPLLTLWQTQHALQAAPDGGIVVRFPAVTGEGFQPIDGYRVELTCREESQDAQGKRSTHPVTKSKTVRPTQTTISGTELNELFPRRCDPEIRVDLQAVGQGTPLSLTYHAGARSVRIPVR